MTTAEEAQKLLNQIRAAAAALHDQTGSLMLHTSLEVEREVARLAGVELERLDVEAQRHVCEVARIQFGGLRVDVMADAGPIEDTDADAREARQMLGLEGR